jgi:hypothetical protein
MGHLRCNEVAIVVPGFDIGKGKGSLPRPQNLMQEVDGISKVFVGAEKCLVTTVGICARIEG